MHLIAGFESQITARGCALAIADAARERSVAVRGVALARLDTERGIHVDPVRGFQLPGHVLRVLDRILEADETSVALKTGETAMVVSLEGQADEDIATLTKLADLDSRGALWIRTE